MLRQVLIVVLLLSATPAFAAQHFGSAMPDGDAQPLAQAVASDAQPGESARKFSGRVTEVCQKKGCWLMLEDDGQSARVMIHDHQFAIPADVRGRATVYGVLSRQELSPEAALHMAEDAGRREAKAGSEYRIAAYAVTLDDI